jgi:hypothetical protein
MPVHRVNEEATRMMWARQEAHAMSLGRLCIAWAVLDRTVDGIFKPMLNCSDAQVASIVTNIENISSRCDILKRLITDSKVPRAYAEWVIALLHRVSGELAPLRNRYVHDSWDITHEEVTKIDKRAKITKAQSRQPDQLLFDTKDVTPTTEVDKLIAKVTLVMAMLSFARFDLAHWQQTKLPIEPHPPYIEASKPRARYRMLQEHVEATRQGPLTSDYVYD